VQREILEPTITCYHRYFQTTYVRGLKAAGLFNKVQP
jgi:hypothetical protein